MKIATDMKFIFLIASFALTACNSGSNTQQSTTNQQAADAVANAAVDTAVKPAITAPIRAIPGGGALLCLANSANATQNPNVQGASNLTQDPKALYCLTSEVIRNVL